MNITFKNISNSLNKAYLKQDITKHEFDRFINSLEIFYQNHNSNESEEHQKNNIAEFFKNSFYKDKYFVNTKGRIDLAIYNGNSSDKSIGVLIEVKSTKNKNEMISQQHTNKKALHEAISYYLEESFVNHNKDIKHIIITNSEEWFIFDGAEFENEFYKNNDLIKKFTKHEQGMFGANSTDWMYNYLEKEIIPKIYNFNCTYFNLFEYKEKVDNQVEFEDDLINLYKILSPTHLLKLPYLNDSNTLDSQFYEELLHLIGLEEVFDSGKKILTRLSGKRNNGSLLENTIRVLTFTNSLSKVTNLKEFGDDEEEQLFSIGLELSITWLNRILFLKLLESQLVQFHNNDLSYKFLNIEKLKDFDELNELFFEVLALKENERASQDRSRFSKIPYLNSSLFEISRLENETILISSLKDRYTLPIFNNTVLKNLKGDKRTGELKFQEYLFEFLDSFNFASVQKAKVNDSDKTIINSAVLGLIFEKLNGYKDGSYFTPGYITMYMCRESITKAVIDKFNETYKWNCKDLIEIYNHLDNSKEKITEYNKLINSIKLVDPAVGSGHFLVSALNEFIYIKSELGILIDKNGKKFKDYKISIVNDELLILDSEDNFFEYLSPEIISGGKREELQRVQETIFHEKQTIIENCLFGVDINPKSVSISRLRLWIELLKFMYYKKTENGYELETLPNIDINIKSGNSLISKFKINSSDSFSLSDKKIIPLYKEVVQKYKNEKSYRQKKKLLIEIENYKNSLKGLIASRSKNVFKLNELKSELDHLLSQQSAFDAFKTKKDEKEFTKKVKFLTDEIQKIEEEILEFANNKVYSNAFEWNYEFPEVLDDNGNFIGFDIVIGNPPYFSLSSLNENTKKVLSNLNYSTFSKTTDIYTIFIERGFQILNPSGLLAFITSNKWMRAAYGEQIRDFLANKTNPILLFDFAGFKVFDSATVDTNIIICEKIKEHNVLFYACSANKDFTIKTSIENYFEKHKLLMPKMSKEPWIISSNNELKIKEKIEKIGTPLKDWDIKIQFGLKTGLNEAFIINGDVKRNILAIEPESSIFIKPILRGRDIRKYKAEFADLWIINIPKGYTIKTMKKTDDFIVSEPIPNYGYFEYDEAWAFFKSNFPILSKYLVNFKDKAEQRQDMGDYWWELRACAYLDEFEKEKIMYSEIVREQQFYYDKLNHYPEATSFIITGESLKYLISLLNSNFVTFIFKRFYAGGGLGESGYRYKKAFLENVPIPKISLEEQQPFIDLVDIILKKKEQGYDITAEEKQIDLMVYKLYELTYEEVNVVEPEFQMTEKEYDRYGEK